MLHLWPFTCRAALPSCLFTPPAGTELSCPILVTSEANVPLYNVVVQGPFVQANCTLPILQPGAAAAPCNAVTMLSASDFVRSFITVAGNVSADLLAAEATFNNTLNLDVTRSVSVTVVPQFIKPSECVIQGGALSSTCPPQCFQWWSAMIRRDNIVRRHVPCP